MSDLEQFVAFAHLLADAAGRIITPYFESELSVEDKADKTPVTRADREAEAAMRGLIEQTYPDHAIYGEEFGQSVGGTVRSAEAARAAKRQGSAEGEGGASLPSNNKLMWVLDPIDGTRAFIAGRREWGTLIALCDDGVPILGLLNQSVTGERWLGVRGERTLYQGQPSFTRICDGLKQAEFSTTSASYFTPEQAARVVALAQQSGPAVRDGDCYAYGLLARGARDIVLDAGLKPYDILALVPIIEGAGGTITGWDGAPITLSHFATALAAGDARLHQETLAILGATA